ncbi:MAG: hypothetical protein MI920_19005 [Kiloniellales bacterium]|nr:hypothetical protein [Kiloniellales bacterium]
MLMGDVRAEGVIRGIEPTIRESLTAEQEAAIRDAVRRNPWGEHPVDIRLSLPLPWRRYYVTLVAGPEKRNTARRQADRRKYPILRLGNIFFFTAMTVAAGLMAVTLLMMIGGVLTP